MLDWQQNVCIEAQEVSVGWVVRSQAWNEKNKRIKQYRSGGYVDIGRWVIWEKCSGDLDPQKGIGGSERV